MNLVILYNFENNVIYWYKNLRILPNYFLDRVQKIFIFSNSSNSEKISIFHTNYKSN